MNLTWRNTHKLSQSETIVMSLPDEEEISRIIHEVTMPFLNDPPYAVDFYSAMGRMVLVWGNLEHSLDDLVTFAFVTSIARGGSHKMETALGRRLDLLKSIYRTCEVLMPLHERVVALTARVKENARHRNLVLHSSWKGFQDGNPPTLKLRNVQHHRGEVTVNDFEANILTLEQIIHNFHLCTSEIRALVLSTAAIVDHKLWADAQAKATAQVELLNLQKNDDTAK
jgi:hypothetical protein